MSTTDSTECDRPKLAVEKMVAHPGLSVKDAMKLADFSIDKREDKNMQRKVLRRLPGKGKRRLKEVIKECPPLPTLESERERGEREERESDSGDKKQCNNKPIKRESESKREQQRERGERERYHSW